mmetsp:Transcript_20719/g.44592  ORF Transcript_20719/g.44592 Transcript_20719/m.44592 type:complete len:384 (+) Transcript_20719:32-1183(+)
MRLAGVVKWFREDKGFGFITPEGGGDDIFVHKSDLLCAAVRDGDTVTYEIRETPGDAGRRGKARALKVDGGSEGPRPTAGETRKWPGGGAHKGTVKFFDDSKGFGYIRPDVGTDDIFVHRNSLACEGLRDGDIVTYDTERDNVRDKLRAINVDGGTGRWEDRRGSESRAVGRPCEGTVKSWNELKGFGFIRAAEGVDDDIFVHRTGLLCEDLQPGDRVGFEMIMDTQKRLRARNVELRPAPRSAGPGGYAFRPVRRDDVGMDRGPMGRDQDRMRLDESNLMMYDPRLAGLDGSFAIGGVPMGGFPRPAAVAPLGTPFPAVPPVGAPIHAFGRTPALAATLPQRNLAPFPRPDGMFNPAVHMFPNGFGLGIAPLGPGPGEHWQG